MGPAAAVLLPVPVRPPVDGSGLGQAGVPAAAAAGTCASPLADDPGTETPEVSPASGRAPVSGPASEPAAAACCCSRTEPSMAAAAALAALLAFVTAAAWRRCLRKLRLLTPILRRRLLCSCRRARQLLQQQHHHRRRAWHDQSWHTGRHTICRAQEPWSPLAHSTAAASSSAAVTATNPHMQVRPHMLDRLSRPCCAAGCCCPPPLQVAHLLLSSNASSGSNLPHCWQKRDSWPLMSRLRQRMCSSHTLKRW